MKPWKPRPFHLWPMELQKIYKLSNKKWEKALAKLFVQDELQGIENIRSSNVKPGRETINETYARR